MGIKENIEQIRKEIVNASLVAVTKKRTVEEIKEAINSGVKTIGENRIQEAESKYNELKDYFKKNKVEFHFIGHLQSNKIRKAVEMFDVIQSVDSLKLAEEINKIAEEKNKTQRIFIEVNIGEEQQKSGVLPKGVIRLVKDVIKLKNIKLEGLMCIPPYSDDAEDSRKYFKQMKDLFDETGLKYLSMGMSKDYRIAIEEGSNMIRIGQGIFGERIK
jgi:PLP dependent protein